MNYYYQVKNILDKWAKDFQKLSKGKEKDKMKEDIKKAIDRFYGTIQIESTNNDPY